MRSSDDLHQPVCEARLLWDDMAKQASQDEEVKTGLSPSDTSLNCSGVLLRSLYHSSSVKSTSDIQTPGSSSNSLTAVNVSGRTTPNPLSETNSEIHHRNTSSVSSPKSLCCIHITGSSGGRDQLPGVCEESVLSHS